MKGSCCAAALLVCAINSQAITIGSEGPASTTMVAESREFSDASFSRGVAEADLPFPGDMECVPQPVYRQRADGKPGREITVSFKAAKLLGKAEVEVKVDGRTETTELPPVAGGAASCRVLLPADVGMNREAQVALTLRRGSLELKKTAKVPAMRHWTVFIYPHSHVDIGYTAPQKIIEFIHKRNIEEGIKLAEATRDYPSGARYRWNPEIT
jgi:alpha-mannosidase